MFLGKKCFRNNSAFFKCYTTSVFFDLCVELKMFFKGSFVSKHCCFTCACNFTEYIDCFSSQIFRHCYNMIKVQTFNGSRINLESQNTFNIYVSKQKTFESGFVLLVAKINVINYKQLRQNFIDNYGTQTSNKNVISHFNNLKQRKVEPVQEFFSRVGDIAYSYNVKKSNANIMGPVPGVYTGASSLRTIR